jgi:hypothetical protein
LTKWWDDEVLKSLPKPNDLLTKACSEIIRVNPTDEMVDSYFDYYRPYEFNMLEEEFAVKITHSVRLVLVAYKKNQSQWNFCVSTEILCPTLLQTSVHL